MKVVLLLACFVAIVAAAKLTVTGDVVPDSYIVVLKDGADKAAHLAFLAGYEHNVTFNYAAALNGYAMKATKATLAVILARDEVDYVEADQMMHASCNTQKGATWGIVRTNVETLSEMSNFEYIYEANIGANVDNYVIDTGIYLEHIDFGSRAKWGTNTVDSVDTDENGHGTHCAGTIGGGEWGVAKDTNLFAVKVLNKQGSGTNSGVIAGIDYVATAARKTGRPSVANMSLGGGKSTALNTACDNTVKDGVHMAVAAGNDNRDACSYSPASAALVVTVGATTDRDARSSFSNYGTCVDIFGPGSDITSTWIGNNKATATISGTSMACPHTAGILTKWVSQNPTATPAQSKSAINSNALKDMITSVGTGSPNRLLFDACIA